MRRVLLCAGKLGHELIGRRDELSAPVAVVRIEQLYPWPEEQILAILDRYPAATQVCWVQEEPANMGAWNFVHGRLHRILRDRVELRHIAAAEERRARRAGASPSTSASRSSCSPRRSRTSER